jgi:hypothetical protein
MFKNSCSNFLSWSLKLALYCKSPTLKTNPPTICLSTILVRLTFFDVSSFTFCSISFNLLGSTSEAVVRVTS